MISATIIYPELNGEIGFVGIQFESPAGFLRRAVATSMVYTTGQIAVGYELQNYVEQLGGGHKWEQSSESCLPLMVTNFSYRRAADFAVVAADEATEDGQVLPGYMTENQFFRHFFGMDNTLPVGIYRFMCDAIVRRLNAEYNLTLEIV